MNLAQWASRHRRSILFLLAVIIGGSGFTLGPVIGAAVSVVLPEVLSGLAEYRLQMQAGGGSFPIIVTDPADATREVCSCFYVKIEVGPKVPLPRAPCPRCLATRSWGSWAAAAWRSFTRPGSSSPTASWR